MDKQENEKREVPKLSDLSIYEQLYHTCYAYKFGTIGFLELLDAFEEILHIKTQSDQSDAA